MAIGEDSRSPLSLTNLLKVLRGTRPVVLGEAKHPGGRPVTEQGQRLLTARGISDPKAVYLPEITYLK